MGTTRALAVLGTGWLLLGGWLAPLWAQAPTVAQMLAYEPKQKGVVYSTPTPDEQKGCTVDRVKNKQGMTRGWLLVDAKKVPLRRFYASKSEKIDVWSYYKDGVEVYREIDTNFNDRPDQYRWVNGGGMKWGLDANEDGVIDAWRMISAEEVAEEVFLAVQEHNQQRLRALFIGDAELRSLKLSADRTEAVRKSLQGALAKFDKTCKDLPETAQAKFVRVESGVPMCAPADETGEQDLIHFTSRPILYETADKKGEKKHDWLHAGEMVQVGMAWRLLDAPSTQPGSPPISPDGTPTTPPAAAVSKRLQKLLEDLNVIDQSPPPMGTGVNKAVQDYNLKRLAVLQQILQEPELEKREDWIRQVCDNMCNAHMAGHDPSLPQLAQYKDQLVKTQPKSALAAYATYRHLWASYQRQIMNQTTPAKDIAKIQEKWLEELSSFVQTYPKADDTPDALQQLGMGCEFGGRDEEAKRHYKNLADNFPDHHLAAKSRGAIERLGLVGQELKLAGPMLGGGNAFDIAQLKAKNKVVVVYYWASYCQSCVGDFARLKQLQATHGAKGLELVLVNLDDRAEEAKAFLHTNPLPGTHLFQAPPQNASGLQSPFAIQYGILGLPNVFLVGRDGKVLDRTLQVNNLEEALRKAL